MKLTAIKIYNNLKTTRTKNINSLKKYEVKLYLKRGKRSLK